MDPRDQNRGWVIGFKLFVTMEDRIITEDRVAHMDNMYIQRSTLMILVKLTNVRIYLPFSDLFGTKQMRPFGKKMINTI